MSDVLQEKPKDLPHRLKILLSYDGSDFGGWQKQKGGAPTVQEALELGLSRIFDRPIKVMGAGRTDAGVHALGQVAHADVPRLVKVHDMGRALGGVVPSSMVIEDVWEAPQEFNANRSAIHKTYKYLIHTSPRPDALKRRYTLWHPRPLDVAFLQECSNFLVGKHDFKSFQNAGTPTKTTVRHIYRADWVRLDDETIQFTICGNGFLKQMVRNIVGTLLDLHREKEPPQRIQEIMAGMSRELAGKTAAPQGLYLCEVTYPSDLDNKCRKL